MTDLSKLKRDVERMIDQGAPESEIDEYISLQGATIAQVREAPLEPNGMMQTLGDFASRANDELLMGWGPKYRAGMKAILPEALGGTGESYEANLEMERARQDRIDSERPLLSTGARTVGLGAQMATGAGAFQAAGVLPASTAGGRMAQATGLGTATGGVYGAGEADPGDEAFDASLGMGLGAAAGLAGAGVIEGVTSGLAQRGMSGAQKAVKRVAETLMQDGVSPETAAARIKQATMDGAENYALIDAAGENTRRLGRAVKNLGGEAAERLGDFSEARMAGQYDRHTKAVENAFGRQQPVDDVAQRLVDYRRKITDPIYQNITEVVQLPRSLKDRFSTSRAIRDGFQRGQRLAAEFGDTLEPVFINGEFNPKIEQVGAKTLHYIRRGMDDLIEAEKKILPNGQERLSELGAAISLTRRRIDSFLKRNSPAIQKADQIFTTFSKHGKALASGQNYERLTPDQLRSNLSKMGTKERAMYRLGAAWKLHKKLGSMSDNRDITKAFLASPNDRQRINIVMGDGGARKLERLFGFKRAEQQMSRTHQRLSGNSTTVQQQEDMANLTGDKGSQIIRKGMWTSFKDWVADTYSSALGIGEVEKNAISEILTETTDDSLSAMFDMISNEFSRLNSGISTRAIGDVSSTLAAGEVSREYLTR